MFTWLPNIMNNNKWTKHSIKMPRKMLWSCILLDSTDNSIYLSFGVVVPLLFSATWLIVVAYIIHCLLSLSLSLSLSYFRPSLTLLVSYHHSQFLLYFSLVPFYFFILIVEKNCKIWCICFFFFFFLNYVMLIYSIFLIWYCMI